MKLSLSKQSRVTYRKQWNKYCTFIGRKAKRMRITVKDLQRYVAYLYSLSYKASTIKTHLASIKFHAALNGLCIPSDISSVTRMLDGVKKQQKPPRERLPITKSLLHEIVGSIHYHSDDQYLNIMLKSLMLCMYHGCLRASEGLISNTSAHTL